MSFLMTFFFIPLAVLPPFWFIYINDLVDEPGAFMSPTALINKFNLKCTLLQTYGIISAIPSSWKSKIRDFGEWLPVVKSPNMERLFRTQKVTSFTYDDLRKVQRKWNNLLSSPVDDWSTYTISLSYVRVLVN